MKFFTIALLFGTGVHYRIVMKMVLEFVISNLQSLLYICSSELFGLLSAMVIRFVVYLANNIKRG